jgi:hypothetical protein
LIRARSRTGARLISPFGPVAWESATKLDLGEVVIDYPIPKGVNLIEVAGVLPVPEHSVFPTLAEGLFEELHPDKATNLREPVVASFW